LLQALREVQQDLPPHFERQSPFAIQAAHASTILPKDYPNRKCLLVLSMSSAYGSLSGSAAAHDWRAMGIGPIMLRLGILEHLLAQFSASQDSRMRHYRDCACLETFSSPTTSSRWKTVSVACEFWQFVIGAFFETLVW